MSVSRICPRCAQWHHVTALCDQGDALRAYLAVFARQQATADQQEAVALARFQQRTRP
jgi:hypothetical protein